jgi:hypothetical protein
MDRGFILGGIRYDLLDFLVPIISIMPRSSVHELGTAYQVIKDAFIELPFSRSALPELLIVVIQACPVFSEFSEAVLIDIFDPVASLVSKRSSTPKANRMLFSPVLARKWTRN